MTAATSGAVAMRTWLARYLEWLRVHNYSERSVVNVSSSVGQFLRWCDERGLTRPEEITRPILERYQRTLFHHRKPDGRPLTFRTQVARLVRVRGLFRWLVRQNVLVANPASDLEMPRREKRLPKHVLSIAEVERVLALPKQHEVLGLRDRAILEVLYATGLRRSEVAGRARALVGASLPRRRPARARDGRERGRALPRCARRSPRPAVDPNA